MENRTIAKSLKPTFENVTRNFLTDIFYDILFSEEHPNFRFDFREKEAVDFIVSTLENYTKEYSFFEFRKNEILKVINSGIYSSENLPVVVVNDYIKFFKLLKQYYKEDIKLYFKRTNFSQFPVYELKNCFLEIWLRMTPYDFNNPEDFLRRNVKMIQDKTFEKYSNEVCIGSLKRNRNYVVCVKNAISRTWDEAPFEFQILIYDKKDYESNYILKQNFKLPVIRYGIYEKNRKKVCYIGSIQNIDSLNKLDEKYLNLKNNIRKEVLTKELRKECYIQNIEPLKLLSLCIFITFLYNEGITEIEAPSMYVLDYEYHKKRGIKLKESFDKKWHKSKAEIPLEDLDEYERDCKYLSQNYNKENVISSLKTETFIMTLNALLNLYNDANVICFPDDVDNFFRINIPISKPKIFENKKDSILVDMYNLIK